MLPVSPERRDITVPRRFGPAPVPVSGWQGGLDQFGLRDLSVAYLEAKHKLETCPESFRVSFATSFLDDIAVYTVTQYLWGKIGVMPVKSFNEFMPSVHARNALTTSEDERRLRELMAELTPRQFSESREELFPIYTSKESSALSCTIAVDDRAQRLVTWSIVREGAPVNA